MGARARLAAMPLVTLAACAAGRATAADYPTRPVRLVVGFAAGGPTDILTRILAERLSQRTGQQFIVENRTGASSNVAVEAVLNAPRDGYTILVMSTANAINTTFRPSQSFNVLRDLAPVAGLARITYVVAVNPSVPARNIAEFVAYAKARPGAVNAASAGISSSNHLAAALFANMTGIELTHIQYPGNAAAYSDLLAGRVQLIFADLASALQYVKSGGLRGLAVTSLTRTAVLPDLQTIAESVPGYEAYAWYGFAAPRGAPPDVVETLNRAVNASLADPAVKTRFATLGAEAMTFTPAEFGAFMTSETGRWGEVVKAAGFKPEERRRKSCRRSIRSSSPRAPSAPLAYIEAAVHAGYQWIGLRLNASPGLPYHPVVGDAALIHAMKQAIAAGGLTVLDIYSFYLLPDVNVAAFTPALDLASEFGAKYAVTMGADTDWPRMRDNFERLCDLAAGPNLVCAIEPAVIRPLANMPRTLKLIAEAKRNNAAICIDPLNFARAGDTAADLARVNPRLLPYAQITDGMILPGEPNPATLGRMPPNQRRLMGEGMVPVADILDALPAGLPLSVEFPPPDAATDERVWAALVHGNVRAWLDRYYARSQ